MQRALLCLVQTAHKEQKQQRGKEQKQQRGVRSTKNKNYSPEHYNEQLCCTDIDGASRNDLQGIDSKEYKEIRGLNSGE